MKKDRWKSYLNSDPTDWLLESKEPSLRYLTLTEILDKTVDDKEVRKEKKRIMTDGMVPRILAKQEEGGYWGKPEDFYTRSKYKGTVWNLILLAELGADGGDERIEKACDFLLDWSQDRSSGGFSYSSGNEGGSHSGVLSCLTANMVWSMLHLGYRDCPYVQDGLDWILKYQRFDLDARPKGWPYDAHKRCWEGRTCRSGAVKAVKALAEIPPEDRWEEIDDMLEEGAEFLLSQCAFISEARKEWRDFSFPLMWNTDLIEILDLLTKLGYHDQRMKEAIDLVASKQNENGRWKMGRTWNWRFAVSIEKKGEESRWVTLRALRLLKRYYS